MHKDISIPAKQWQRLNDQETGSIRICNLSGYSKGVVLQRGSENEPYRDEGISEGGAMQGAVPLKPDGIVLNEKLTDLWPGASGGYVWAWSEQGGALSVSHA